MTLPQRAVKRVLQDHSHNMRRPSTQKHKHTLTVPRFPSDVWHENSQNDMSAVLGFTPGLTEVINNPRVNLTGVLVYA